MERTTTMDRFDEKIIGYESTKNILRQILDALKRPELYKSKGASIPRGILMESDPGLGKSLLATVFIKESGRKSLVFRKTSQENSFLDELRAAFSAAKEAAPSILLLEDLNLYVESNSPYAPEWACLQACIDDAKNTDIFVIATTNDTKYMPPSLLRPGRFDYTLYLDPPMGKIAERIVSYYLRDKDLAEDVLISDIVKAKLKDHQIVKRTVEPVGLMFSEYYFYLMGIITDHSTREAFHKKNDPYPTIYRLDRIRSIEETGEKFSVPYKDRFKEGEYKNRTQFMFGGEPQKISFNYYGSSVEAVLDKFPMAKVVDEKEGVCSIEAEVFGTGVKMWLLSQGSKVKVTAPETLVQEMKQEIEWMDAQYEQMGGKTNG